MVSKIDGRMPKSLQATRDDASTSASSEDVIRLACLSWMSAYIARIV